MISLRVKTQQGSNSIGHGVRFPGGPPRAGTATRKKRVFMKLGKLNICLVVAALMLCLRAQAGLFTFNSPTLNQLIPDGNPVGWSTTMTVSGADSRITDVNVRLNITGGYNGDLYAYLSYGGALVPLLNRVGTATGDQNQPQYSFGFSTSGFGSIYLDDEATAGNIHGVATPVSFASYRPDSGATSLTAFDNKNPNGTWTLFFADLSNGEQSQIVDWSLQIEAVPEPVPVALAIFAGVFVVSAISRSRHVRGFLRARCGASTAGSSPSDR